MYLCMYVHKYESKIMYSTKNTSSIIRIGKILLRMNIYLSHRLERKVMLSFHKNYFLFQTFLPRREIYEIFRNILKNIELEIQIQLKTNHIVKKIQSHIIFNDSIFKSFYIALISSVFLLTI